MIQGRVNFILDAFWGSSGKGKTSAWLADHFNVCNVSSANFPNAGHSAVFKDGTKFVAKAIPTAAILRKTNNMNMDCYISPGSGFHPVQLLKEIKECDFPNIYVHERASLVLDSHVQREREGAESTKHIASTMQGSGTAISDKVMRKANTELAGIGSLASSWIPEEYRNHVKVLKAQDFRDQVHMITARGNTILHEGSQGYALSIDHGSHYPNCTSRNCSVQAAMDFMAVPPAMVGDVYLNLRSFPIRVGNVVEDGVQKGYSGDFYPDCTELTWEQVAKMAGMPEDEANKLAERERTTVTKRIRRVSTFSYLGLKDAVRVNGATKLVMNFIQYINWKDAGLKGGREAFEKLSKESREFIDSVEEAAGIPVVLIGTGALHDEMITRL